MSLAMRNNWDDRHRRDKREHSRGHGLPLTRGELLLVILGGVIIGLNLIGLPLLAGLT